MAKATNVRVRKSMLSSWQQQTRDLLNKLLKERPQVVDQLAAIDEEIAMLRNALGRSAGAGPAPRGRGARKAAPKQRGGIAAAVLGVLASKKVASVQEIVGNTGLARGQVYPCLMNLKAQKKIAAAERGSYKLTARGASASRKTKAKKAGKKRTAKKTRGKKTRGKKTRARKTGAKKTKRKGGRRGGKGSRGPRGAVSAAVMKVLQSRKNGVSRPELIKATGMDDRQVSACIMNMKKAGKVKTVSRGVYAAA